MLGRISSTIMRRTFRAFRGAGRGAGVGGWVGAGVGIGAGVGATARVPDVEVDPCFGFATPFFFILHIPSSPHSVQLSHAGVEKQDAQQASELFVENVFSTTQPSCLSQSVEPANEVPAHCKKMPWDSSRAIQNTSAVNRILFLILSRFSMRDARRQWILALRWLTQVCTRCRPYLRYVRHSCVDPVSIGCRWLVMDSRNPHPYRAALCIIYVFL